MRNASVTVIGEDLVVEGEIRGGAQVEVRGRVEGKIDAAHVLIHPGGRVNGTVVADNADISGALHGTARVKNLIAIGDTGSVHGDVRYGRLALAAGGELSADVRNVPPELAGDFQVVVRRGRSVPITTEDINAVDPDDSATQLRFSVTNPVNGFVTRAAAPRTPVEHFTQAELSAGGVLFLHDGATGANASFDVVVNDHTGAASGAPRTVQVAVVGTD